MTPSDAVDQAWHLHLSYTRSYWDDLCGRVIGSPLHHQPTAGGAMQARHWRARYTATLDRYALIFGQLPPAAIWPPASARFATRFARVDMAHNWIVPQRVGAVAALAIVAPLAMAATGIGIAVVGLVGLSAVIAAAFGGRSRKGTRRRGTGGDGGTTVDGSDDPDGDGDGGGSDSSGGCGGGCGGD